MKIKLLVVIMLNLFMCLILVVSAYSKKLESVEGHSIRVDKDIRDWVGVPPIEENTSVISKGEFIFKDAQGDDTGDGNYEYPDDKSFGRCADLREFRVTFDRKNVYFLIRFNKPNEFWAPYCLIGIDKDGAKGGYGGTVLLAQGDIDYISTDEGTYAELKVTRKLACGFTIGIFSSFKGRIWNHKGKLIAQREGSDEDTPGFIVDDYDWSSVEVAIPQSIIGNPAGKTWRFIVATGLEDHGHLRELAEETSQWHGGGGIGTGEEGEVEPDVYDLASPSTEIQEKELSSFNPRGRRGNKKAFAHIEDSYLEVKFAR